MTSGYEDELPDPETFHTDCPIPEEIGCTSSSGEDDDDETPGPVRKRPRLAKPWCDLLFPKARIEMTPSVLRGMTSQKELEFRRYLSDTILTLVQKLSLSLDTYSVAVLFMHRFLMYRPVQTIDKRKLSLACVFLASKTNEDRRPPIATFVCTFYRLCCRRELNPSKDHNVYQRLYQELLFWESQILLVLGFNMYYNLREVRREIDAFCEEQVHIPRQILRCALCVFVLNTLALTTLPVRCSYRVIYLVSISLTLAWAGLSEPRVSHNGTLWWQFLCLPNNPTVEEFESMKAETLRVFEVTNTKFQEYFASRQNASANTSQHSGGSSSTAKVSSRSANKPSTSAHQASHPGGSDDAEGLTGTPIISASHHNGVGATGPPSSSHDRPQQHNSNLGHHRQPYSHQQHHHRPHNSSDPALAGHQGRMRGAHPPVAASSSSTSGVHKHHHKHSHHRERSERPFDAPPGGSGERRSKERRSSKERQHRRRSRSSHHREAVDGRGDGAPSVSTEISWDQQPQHDTSKSINKRPHFSAMS